MEGLKKDVLPKIGVKIVTDRVSCAPNTIGITTPELTVSALVALPKADDSTAAPRLDRRLRRQPASNAYALWNAGRAAQRSAYANNTGSSVSILN